ncbi:unnamed protein product [Calypogeia fissa]
MIVLVADDVIRALLLLSGCRAGTARVEIDGLRRRSLSFHRFEVGMDACLVEGFFVEFTWQLTTAGRVSSLAEWKRREKKPGWEVGGSMAGKVFV